MSNDFQFGERPFSVAVAPRVRVSDMPWRIRFGKIRAEDVTLPYSRVQWVEREYIDRKRNCWVCLLRRESTGEAVSVSVFLDFIDSVANFSLDECRSRVRAVAISKSQYPTANVTV